MSKSFAPDREPDRPPAEPLAAVPISHGGSGDSPAPAGGAEPDIDAALDAELSDHLASAAAELVRRGEAEAAAAARAVAQFGDVARIKRQCWWIHKGDEVMFRTAGIALLGLLTLAVVVVVVGGWQFQRNLASRTEQLSEQLAALTATQQAMLAQQRPPEITGLCYLGDRSQPAANVELQVCRFSEQPSGGSAMPGRRGVVTRRVRTDERGRFTSGGLPEGDYCLLAPLQRTDGKHDEAQPIFNTLQSRPVYSLTGGGSEAVDFDLLPHAQIELECDGSLPDTIKIGEHQFQILISADVWPLPLMSGHFPLAPSDEPANRRWPLPGNIGSGPGASVDSSPSKLPRSAALPAFDYHINVRLSISPPPVVAETADDDSHPAVRRIPQFGDAGLGARRFALDGGSAFYSVVEVHDIRAGERLKIRVSLIGEPLADRVPALLAAAEESRTFSKGAVAQPNYEPIVLNNMAQALARDIKLDVKVTREPIESEALSAK